MSDAQENQSVAAEEGTLKRSIQMKMFASKADQAKVILAYEDVKSPSRGDAAKSSLTVGQIIGQVFAIKEKVGTLPNGDQKMSLLAIGDFEAVNYTTGEVVTSTAAYLPSYFLETIQAMFEKGAEALEFAVEIVIVPTGKSIPFAYEVRNLIKRRPESALNKLKAELANAGRLRLPPPTPIPTTALEGEVLSIGADEVDVEAEEVGEDEGEQASGDGSGEGAEIAPIAGNETMSGSAEDAPAKTRQRPVTA